MINITARITRSTSRPGHQRVEVYTGPRDGFDSVLAGALVMKPEEATELIARLDAGELGQTAITPEIAAHVLWHYDATGGMEPDTFTRSLITTIDRADRENVLRLAAVYPDYSWAVHLAKNTEDGIRILQDIARQALVTPGTGA